MMLQGWAAANDHESSLAEPASARYPKLCEARFLPSKIALNVSVGLLLRDSCYGTWLHGDERGSVDRFHNQYQAPYIPHNERWRAHNAQALKCAPVLLNAAQRESVEAAVRQTCALRNWLMHAINGRTNHVHVVVAIGTARSEHALNAVKANATRQLRQDGQWRQQQSPWADKGSRRHLWNARSIERAIDYVINGQGDKLPEFQ